MYSSPVTPAGTGHSHPPSTYRRVLATGGPIGGTPGSAGIHRVQVTSTQASTGPYPCTSSARGNVSKNRSRKTADSTSPPVSMCRAPDHPSAVPPSPNPSSAEGTRCITVTAVLCASRATYLGSAMLPAEATTRLAPAASGQNSCHTDGSNPSDAVSRNRSAAPHPHALARASTWFTTDAWVMATPFGTPVDPDVYITY